MNLAEIQAAIQAHGYAPDTSDRQTIFINQCYREVCGMQRWPFLEAQDVSQVTTAGQAGYPLDALPTWRSIDAVRISIPAQQQYVRMEYLAPQDFRDREHISPEPSTPSYWTFINQELRFWPVPDDSYSVTIDYISEPPDLAADADVPVLPVTYHDVLVWGAVERLAYRERDWLGRQFAQQERELSLKRMDEEFMVRQRQTSSHVKKSGYWGTQPQLPMTGF